MSKKEWLVIGLLFVIITGFFFKPIFRGLAPIPLDIMAGAYYPWLDDKWGYSVGVPVKNPSVTDAFSQLYPWRVLSMDAWRDGEIPLWNPYSFSGTPLLANWQSAPFYPLNILMIFLGNMWGWSAMVVLQPMLAMLFMYLYLREIKLGKAGSFLGATTFAFGGFMTTYLEYATAGQIFLWLPLLLWVWEKYFETKDWRWLGFAALLFFPILTAGFFQPAFYALMIAGSYAMVKIVLQKSSYLRNMMIVGTTMLTGLGLAAIQLIPTFELLGLSIRNFDHNIEEYRFGLLPLKHIVTFWAPDFLGNPATYNFWGFMGYQETVGYWGIVAMVFVLVAITIRQKTWINKFYIFWLVVSLVLAFDTPVGRLIYQYKVPFLSTGYASRLLLISGFSAAVLAAIGLDNYQKTRLKWPLVTIFAGWVGIGIGLFATKLILQSNYLKGFPEILASDSYLQSFVYMKTAIRNMIVPGGLSVVALVGYVILGKKKLFPIFICGLAVLDILRFSIKFTPFSKPEFATDSLPVFEFLKKNVGNYRIDKENGPILPSNTWIYSKLKSPSGYDPLIYKAYGSWYKVYNNGQSGRGDQRASRLDEGWFTRYLELDNYKSPIVDLAGVKYLLALKKDDRNEVISSGKKLHYNIPLDKFKKVFEYGATVVLENKDVMPRVMLVDKYTVEPDQIKAQETVYDGFDFRNGIVLDKKPTTDKLSNKGSVEIVSYKNNRVIIKAETKEKSILVLTDTYYPGWKVNINDKPAELMMANGIYRAVELPAGENSVSFVYQPESFDIGKKVSTGSLILIFAGLVGNFLKIRIDARNKKSKKTK